MDGTGAGEGDQTEERARAPEQALRPRALLARLLGPASAYWAGNALTAGLGFLLLPLLTRYLSPADYGAVAMFTLVTAVADPLLGLNLAAAVTRRYYSLPPEGLARYVGTCLSLLLGTTLLGLLGGLLLEGPLTRLTLLPLGWVLVALSIGPINAVFGTAAGLLQARERPWAHLLLTTFRACAGAGLAVWLVVGLELGWQGRAGSALGSALLALPAALLVLAMSRAVRPGWDPAHARHALAYGLPLVPHVLSGVAMSVTDRLFLVHMVDLSSAGLYAVGFQVGFLMAMLQDGFNKAWVPWLFARLGTAGPADKARLVRLTYLYDLGLIALALLLSLLLPALLGLIVPARFDGAWPFVRWIMLAYAFEGAYKMVANYIFYAERTHLLAVVSTGAALLNVPLTWAMIRWQGPIGAAQATAMVSLLMWLLTWVLSARCYPMPWWGWRSALRRGQGP